MNHTITPILLGRFIGMEKSSFTHGKDFGVGLNCPLFVFLVRGGGRTVLFDCGPVSPALAPAKTHRPMTHHISLTEGLKSQGLTPADIDCVVLSHLHWDHSYNLELFPDKPIYIQGAELAYGIDPLPCHYVSCNVRNGNGVPQWLDGFESMVVLHGDHHLAQGLDIVCLPGHTPGLHGLVVDTAEGKYLLGSDHYPLMENYTCGIPAGIHTDNVAWTRSHERVLQMGVKVIPAHDDCVLSRKVYG